MESVSNFGRTISKTPYSAFCYAVLGNNIHWTFMPIYSFVDAHLASPYGYAGLRTEIKKSGFNAKHKDKHSLVLVNIQEMLQKLNRKVT